MFIYYIQLDLGTDETEAQLDKIAHKVWKQCRRTHCLNLAGEAPQSLEL